MKAVFLLITSFALASTQTVVDPTPARMKLQEVVAEIEKKHEDCLRNGKTPEECKKIKENELYANGMPKDWFEKGDKEYRDFWSKLDSKQKK